MNAEELEVVLKDCWEHLQRRSKEEVLNYRKFHIKLLDGDIFYKICKWPKYIRRIFFQNHAPIGDKQTFILILFFVGNGVSFYRAGRWILSPHALFDWTRAKHSAAKRIRQIKGIRANIGNNQNKWSYFDIDRNRILYLNGEVFKP